MELTMPNGMTLTQQFETQRDLLTGMLYKRGETSVVERFYTYDNLGRPLTRQQNRQGGSRNDSFTHNDRSELTAGILGTKGYYYSYDNIGNRKTAKEDADEATSYDANALNQYTAVGDFVPEFDADGNQTKVQTSTGIWDVMYNAENRPTVFSRANENGTTTRVTCAYDYMGRRATKKVETITTNAETEESTASTTLNQRYLYRGYLQVACCDLTRSAHPCLWLITWDPTQPTATRPLAIQKDATWYVYGWDLTKNICEVFSYEGYISNTVIYSYTPYGAVSASGTVTQPIQWSSEFYDNELGLVYYNYRHYNPANGRWMCRDKAEDGCHLYRTCNNSPILYIDSEGLAAFNFDESTCRLNVTLKWKLIFEDTENMRWTRLLKEAWKSKAKNVVEGYYNNQQRYKCISECPCTLCKLGVTVKLTVNFVSQLTDDAFSVTVLPERTRSRVNPRARTATFDRFDVEPTQKPLDRDNPESIKFIQTPIVHEVTHMLGRLHPGQYVEGRKPRRNSPADYRVDAGSLTGIGMELRDSDFQGMFCSKGKF